MMFKCVLVIKNDGMECPSIQKTAYYTINSPYCVHELAISLKRMTELLTHNEIRPTNTRSIAFI